MIDHAVHIHNLHYSYPPAVPGTPLTPALAGIELTVESGQFLALMGPARSGKTTLCLALNGLVPRSTCGTYRGDVVAAGLNTRSHPVAELSTHVGLVFQNCQAQLFNLTVEDEVAFGPESLGLPLKEIAGRIDWALAAVGMSHLRQNPPGCLSGGQQRRLAIAAVLAMRPEVLVLDDPTAGLDPLGRQSVLEVIAGLCHQGTTVIMATQDADAVAPLADRVVVLDAGRVVEDGPAAVLGGVARLHSLGVDAPQMAEVSACLGVQPAGLTVDAMYGALRSGEGGLTTPPDDKASGEDPARQTNGASEGPLPLPPLSQPLGRGGWGERASRDSGRLHLSCSDAVLSASAHPTSSVSSPIVSFEEISFQYAGTAVDALNGISLSIEAGEFVALVGANGSGKTTLAKHVNGLLQPGRGRVLVGGQDTRQVPPGRLARRVGYVFQNPDNQIFAATVREEVAYGPRNLGLAQSAVTERVDAALAALDLTQLADVPPATLGYDLRRLVTLASVHAMSPEVLILDEPTAGLDRRLTARVLDWALAWHAAGRSVVLITHDLRLAARASRWVVLAEGRVVLDGPPRAACGRPDLLVRAGITPPPVAQLGQRLGLAVTPLTVEDFCRAYGERAGGEVGA